MSPTIRFNPMRLSQLSAFLNIRGGLHNGIQDIYFIEWLGLPMPPDQLIDTLIQSCAQGHRLLCLCTLPTTSQKNYTTWANQFLSGQSISFHLDCISDAVLSDAIHTALNQYNTSHPQASDSMRCHCIVRLLDALHNTLPTLFPTTCCATDRPKCVWIGSPDEMACLFLSMLPYLGCDVAVIRPDGVQPLLPQAVCLTGQTYPNLYVTDLVNRVHTKACPSTEIAASAPQSTKRLVIPPHPKRSTCAPPTPSCPSTAPTIDHGTPLDYETLAGFAPSVVMIEVLDQQGNPCSTGSGVIIAPGGIVLTNFHVVSRGTRYAIHTETCESVFQTHELLKYHADYDLALLRVPGCPGRPIPIYTGNKLVRGQQVFAIGSPLGLFNSVSDGIISGFRTLEYTDMIQFTAPTSPGSSGGALLDRFGKLIGIVTAGYSDGQNLNLAVSYSIIQQFAQGFI